MQYSLSASKKIDGTAINDAEDLDLVQLLYNLLEYSSNCSDATGSLQFYSKDEATSFNVNITDTDASDPLITKPD